MSAEQLVKVNISGAESRLDEAVGAFLLGCELHAAPPSGSVPDTGDESRPALDAAVSLMSRLGIQARFAPFEDRGYTLADTAEYIDALAASCRKLTERSAELRRSAEEKRAVLKSLEPYSLLNVELSLLVGAEDLSTGFGHLPTERWESLRSAASETEGMLFCKTGESGGKTHFVYAALPRLGENARELASTSGAVMTPPPELKGLTGAPSELTERLGREAQTEDGEAARLDGELNSLAESSRDELLSRYSYLKYTGEVRSLRSKCSVDGGSFFLSGWTPESERGKIEEKAKALGCRAEFEKPTESEKRSMPVKLKTGFFSKIFAPFVEMYGPPAYGEIDPRIFMLITYSLLFGMMFGDVGQGAVLILVGAFMAVKKKSWLGGMLCAVGVPAIGFGFVYGSVFGNEHLLPGFKVLEGNGVMSILVITALVGVVLIIVCGVLNTITGFRQKDLKKALFSANGVCGVLFIALLALSAVSDLTAGMGLLKSGALWCVLVLLLLLIWFGEPLAYLLGGRKGEFHGGGTVILEGFFDVFEAFLSWLSNILSFLRVGTYAICHAIMMTIVYTISATEGGYSPIGLVLGNALVMVIETVLVCIQCLRLEFYELFGRFYTGRGEKFSSAAVNYTETGAHAS